ncbi:ubiquitin hydrolase B [Cavenderia fasciculata]|uniref:Ubiquitin hydrolase B n=1 Tax=Cavenderia fasciculata TaxID=261658 RepID=F4Q4L6_CACFS|nr:ubiquitin hydrolase B [Cavenderia fasciculata]EGG17025.1 ubiquitin hydrolase B [Cavenderia fasciculata]|eukprot:XP_004355509.1 ubiquitin hydrolase B [Cavenderia fasciculata]
MVDKKKVKASSSSSTNPQQPQGGTPKVQYNNNHHNQNNNNNNNNNNNKTYINGSRPSSNNNNNNNNTSTSTTTTTTAITHTPKLNIRQLNITNNNKTSNINNNNININNNNNSINNVIYNSNNNNISSENNVQNNKLDTITILNHTSIEHQQQQQQVTESKPSEQQPLLEQQQTSYVPQDIIIDIIDSHSNISHNNHHHHHHHHQQSDSLIPSQQQEQQEQDSSNTNNIIENNNSKQQQQYFNNYNNTQRDKLSNIIVRNNQSDITNEIVQSISSIKFGSFTSEIWEQLEMTPSFQLPEDFSFLSIDTLEDPLMRIFNQEQQQQQQYQDEQYQQYQQEQLQYQQQLQLEEEQYHQEQRQHYHYQDDQNNIPEELQPLLLHQDNDNNNDDQIQHQQSQQQPSTNLNEDNNISSTSTPTPIITSTSTSSSSTSTTSVSKKKKKKKNKSKSPTTTTATTIATTTTTTQQQQVLAPITNNNPILEPTTMASMIANVNQTPNTNAPIQPLSPKSTNGNVSSSSSSSNTTNTSTPINSHVQNNTAPLSTTTTTTNTTVTPIPPVTNNLANLLMQIHSTSTTANTATKPPTPISTTNGASSAIQKKLSWIRGFDEHISKMKTLPYQAKGMVNTSNTCFMNVILQSLIGCQPFVKLLKSISDSEGPSQTKYPTLHHLKQFHDDYFSTIQVSNNTSKYVSSPQPINPKYFGDIVKSFNSKIAPPSPSPIIPFSVPISNKKRTKLTIYEAVQQQSLNSCQQDAQEFLTYFLDLIHEEFVSLLKEIEGPKEEKQMVQPILEPTTKDNDGWEIVGAKNKTSTVNDHTTNLNGSPISQIFSGTMRSSVNRSESKESVTLQPFYCLHLDVRPESVHTLEEALSLFMKEETLEGYTCSTKGVEVTASKSMSIEVLPKILIVHFKRFAYDTEAQKLDKFISFPTTLTLKSHNSHAPPPSQPQTFASTILAAASAKKYSLLSVVSHHGKGLSQGHYTCDVLQPNLQWMRFDDALVSEITEQEVLNREAYLLLYQQA